MENLNWINFLIDYWINRCNIKNNINNIDIDKINILLKENKISFNNFSCLKGYYSLDLSNVHIPESNFKFEFDETIAYTNNLAKQRIIRYTDYFNKINNNFNFKFLMNHLDCFPKLEILNNINMIYFGCSAPNIENNNCIPIIDAHNLWDAKKMCEYNLNYDFNFNNSDFRTKINKIVWRGALIPTFTKEELGLMHLRLTICEKYNNNSNFDIGYTSNDYNHILLQNKNFLNYNDFTKFKYILNIDGYGASFEGTIWKLRSTSLLIWITDENNEFYWLQWYYPLLKPYVHYVPSSIDNLEKTFEWCESNQDKCIEIISNSTKLINDILLNTDEYHKQLFNKINQIYNNL
jgi:hypothetical protein